MNNPKRTILLFTDLDGTLLTEDGKINTEAIQDFLEELRKLQKLTDAEVNIHLVSPIEASLMKKVMKEINTIIRSFNESCSFVEGIQYIKNAGAFPNPGITNNDSCFEDGIIYFPRPSTSPNFEASRYGKEIYVINWCDVYQSDPRRELVMSIYCGNDRNDIGAMNIICSQKNGRSQKTGFVVCPNNSSFAVKEISDFVSDRDDVAGIANGIHTINAQIKRARGIVTHEGHEEPGEETR